MKLLTRRECDKGTGYVYFILNTDRKRIKIGSAWDVQTRKYNLQVSASEQLDCILVIPFGNRDEAYFREAELHELFKDYRVRGKDWFRYVPEIWAFIILFSGDLFELPDNYDDFLSWFPGYTRLTEWFQHKCIKDEKTKVLLKKWRTVALKTIFSERTA